METLPLPKNSCSKQECIVNDQKLDTSISKPCRDDKPKQILTIKYYFRKQVPLLAKEGTISFWIAQCLTENAWSRTLEKLRTQTNSFSKRDVQFCIFNLIDIFVQFLCKASLTNKQSWRLDITWNFLLCLLEFSLFSVKIISALILLLLLKIKNE